MANKRFGDYPVRVTPLDSDALLLEGEQIGEYHRLLLSYFQAALTDPIDDKADPGEIGADTPGPAHFSLLEVIGRAWSKPVDLADAANIATDASLSNVFRVVLGGDRTLDNPTNLQDGTTLIWVVKQDATGGRTLSFDTAFVFPVGVTPSLNPDPNARTIITGLVEGTDILVNQLQF